MQAKNSPLILKATTPIFIDYPTEGITRITTGNMQFLYFNADFETVNVIHDEPVTIDMPEPEQGFGELEY